MSKESILEKIQKNKPGRTPLPEIVPSEVTHNPDEQTEWIILFKQALEQVGAKVTEEMPPENTLTDFTRPEVKEKYASCSADQLYELDTILLNGRFGVAENGAIWMEEEDFPHRLLPFVAQQLVIRLDKKQIVRNMHEAYSLAHPERTGFGVFISGPSKTADIEQSLVYGAHGAKTLTVVLSDTAADRRKIDLI